LGKGKERGIGREDFSGRTRRTVGLDASTGVLSWARRKGGYKIKHAKVRRTVDSPQVTKNQRKGQVNLPRFRSNSKMEEKGKASRGKE